MLKQNNVFPQQLASRGKIKIFLEDDYIMVIVENDKADFPKSVNLATSSKKLLNLSDK